MNKSEKQQPNENLLLKEADKQFFRDLLDPITESLHPGYLRRRLKRIALTCYGGKTLEYLKWFDPEMYAIMEDQEGFFGEITDGKGFINKSKVIEKKEKESKEDINRKISVDYFDVNDLDDYIEKNHKGKSRTELQNTDSVAYHVARKKKRLIPLVQKGILVDKSTNIKHRVLSLNEKINETPVEETPKERRHNSFYEGKGFEKYLIENFGNKPSTTLFREDFSSYSHALRKGLIKKLRAQGYFPRAGCKKEVSVEKITAVPEETAGEQKKGVFEGKVIIKDECLEQRVQHINLTDEREQIKKKIIDNYSGKTSTDLIKLDFTLYAKALDYGLISELRKEGVIANGYKKRYENLKVTETVSEESKQKTKKRDDLSYKLRLGEMKYFVFRRFIEKNYPNTTVSQLKEKDPVAFKVASDRFFLNKLVIEHALLEDDVSKDVVKETISVEERLNYIRANFKGKSASFISKVNPKLYMWMINSGNYCLLVKEGTLFLER